jgi:ribosome biogenesis protein Nip4
MSILFRELSSEEKQIVNDSLVYWISTEQKEELDKRYGLMIAEGKWIELFLVTKETKDFLKNNPNVTPYTIGLGLGEIRQKELYLTLSGGAFLCPHTRKKAVIADEAEQLFLYKNHLYAKSILNLSEDVQVNDKLLVTNKQDDFLGIGQLVIPFNEVANNKTTNLVAIKNILDLGWYLRKGK